MVEERRDRIRLESKFQADLIDTIKKEFPGAIVLKNDPDINQGFPDLTILWEDRWAVLEVKRSKDASHQPNQDYYVNRLDAMSYSSFVYPENMKEVIDGIQRAFGTRR